MYAGPTKAITGSVLKKNESMNEKLSYVDEFRYLGNVITADCRADKDIGNQFRRQNAVCCSGSSHLRKFPMEVSKSQLFEVILLFNLWMCCVASVKPILY